MFLVSSHPPSAHLMEGQCALHVDTSAQTRGGLDFFHFKLPLENFYTWLHSNRNFNVKRISGRFHKKEDSSLTFQVEHGKVRRYSTEALQPCFSSQTVLQPPLPALGSALPQLKKMPRRLWTGELPPLPTHPRPRASAAACSSLLDRRTPGKAQVCIS